MAAPAAAPGISRKLKKILDTRTEGAELRSCLESLSAIYPENTSAARRTLRSTIDDQALEHAVSFLSSLEDVVGVLDGIQGDLDELAVTCRQAQERVSSSKTSSVALLNEYGAAQRQLEASRRRSQSVDVFLSRYQLRPDQLAALTRTENEAPDEAFFAALRQVEAVRSNCRALMVGRHQRAALELMEQMASVQEAAYERLCRWVRLAGPALADGGSDIADERSAPLRAALCVLRGRPVLLTYCVDEVAAARHAALFQRFIRALTQGPRPIEVQAADPRRYVGDMLAWVHAALELERDLLSVLLADSLSSHDDGLNMEQIAADDDKEEDRRALDDEGEDPNTLITSSSQIQQSKLPTLETVLDKIFESICRPLKIRLEQCLLAGPSPVLCYWMAQVLTFYLQTLGRLLIISGEAIPKKKDQTVNNKDHPAAQRPALLETLFSVRSLALRAFHEQVRQQRDKAGRYPLSPPRDLSPPPQLGRQAVVLADLVACRGAALNPACAEAGAEAQGGFEAMLNASAEPLLEMVRRSAEALDPHAPARLDDGSHLEPSDRLVYTVNCLGLLLSQVESAPAAESLAAKLRLLLADCLSELVDAEAARALARCGLAETAARVKLHQAGDSGTRLAEETGMELSLVADAVREFFGKLSAPDVLPEFQKLQLPRIREELIHRVSVALADAHALVYEALMDPASGYDTAAVEDALKHKPTHVRTLLGLH